MKIKSLHLVNFRIYEEIVIELADINIFSGDNGGGKTTIREAIEFLLTGRCQWTDARGVGKEELIRTGAAELMVEADIEGIGLVRRSIPGGLSIEGWTGTSADQQKILFQQLGADADTITAVLNSTYFLALEDAEQANMIFNLMGAKFNQTSLLKAFEKYSVCFTSDEIDTFNKFYPKNLTGGPEVFEKLEKVFRDKRTETNRVVKELKVLQGKQTKPEGYIECTANEKAQAEMRLSALRHERDIFVAAGAGETERTEQRERTQKRVDDTKTAIGKLQGQKDATEFDAERFLRLTDEMAANWVKIKAFQEEENLAKEKSDRLSGEINALQNTHDSLTENGGNCPLAPEHLKCPVGETDRYKLANTILKDLNKKRRELEEANGSLSKIRISKNAAVAGVESLETEIDILARTKEKIREIDQSIADSNELLGQYEEDLAAIPAANNDENHDEEITQLNDKILEVEGQVTKMVASLQYKANADSLKKLLAEKEHDSGSLESLIEDFGPKGIKQKMIAKTI
jgi:DNA repair exonuclease SbcCD ATPase subunit